MESQLEKDISQVIINRKDNYKLIEPKEWMPFCIGAYLNWCRWESYEHEHPNIKTKRLKTTEVGALFFFNSYQIATTLGALLGAYYLFNRVF